MRSDAEHRAPEEETTVPLTVRVERNWRGGWEVVMADRHRVVCETLEDARRVAYLQVARARPCELIVHDAYHRVLHRERIDGNGDPATAVTA
jgi:hypothetical protein